VAKLLDTGVDTIKTDFGERVPHLGVKWHDNSDPWKMHKWVMSHVVDQSGLRKNNTPTWTPADNSRSYYTQLYNDVVFKTIQKTHGASEAALFARSATAGGQRFPVHWGGDCESSFEAMAETLRGGLSLSSSGFAFWSHDIGGFEGHPPEEIFCRWVAFGLFSSHVSGTAHLSSKVV
jgi:alpha-glucosidase (family GH31 glycosyl hydrolase)